VGKFVIFDQFLPYLRNSAKMGHNYYEMLTGSHVTLLIWSYL